MVVIATLAASLVTNNGRSARFIGVLGVDGVPDLRATLYPLPP